MLTFGTGSVESLFLLLCCFRVAEKEPGEFFFFRYVTVKFDIHKIPPPYVSFKYYKTLKQCICTF